MNLSNYKLPVYSDWECKYYTLKLTLLCISTQRKYFNQSAGYSNTNGITNSLNAFLASFRRQEDHRTQQKQKCIGRMIGLKQTPLVLILLAKTLP